MIGGDFWGLTSPSVFSPGQGIDVLPNFRSLRELLRGKIVSRFSEPSLCQVLAAQGSHQSTGESGL